MKPIKFPEATKDLLKPKGMTDEECGSLPVWNGDEKQCISCWKMTPKERIKALIFGRVWLGVLSGQTQPPVWMDIKKTVFENASISLTWFNAAPRFLEIGEVLIKPYNLFCRFCNDGTKHFGFGILQVDGRHLFYFGKSDKNWRLSILFFWLIGNQTN